MPLKCRHASRSLILILTVLIVAAWTADAFAGGKKGGGGDVGVKGYYRKNGTYVQPHKRSAPDSNPHNNYGMPGNYNPNKGTITPGNPDTYLDRYYEKKGVLPKTPSDARPKVPGVSPARGITAEEVDRHLKGLLQREGASDAKCIKKQYGSGWVTVCE